MSNILGIKHPSSVNSRYTLSKLGMDSLMDSEIKQTLERNFDLVLSLQEIHDLMFEKFLDLTSHDKDVKVSVKDSGKSNVSRDMADEFLFQLEGTEIVPNQSLVQLETKSLKGAILFVIHAIEGVIFPFRALAGKLNRPVWGFQCTQDIPLDSLMDTASAYIKQMKQIQSNGPYQIAGYSFGACIAFEMGLQLEKTGEAILTLIDGSTAFISSRTIINKTAMDNNENSLLDNYKKCFAFFVNQLKSNISFNQAYNNLKLAQTKEEAVNEAVKMINSTRFIPVDLKITAMMLVKKLRASDMYKPAAKFTGKINHS